MNAEQPYGRYDNLNVYLICSAETSVGTPSYKTHMRLTIFSVSMVDYTTYKCVAKNPRGETDGSIRLYGKLPFANIIFLSHFFSSLVFYKIQYILFNGFGLRVIVGNDNTTTSDGERFAATMRFLHSCCLNLKRVGRRWGIGFDREIGLSTFTIAIGDATPHCRDRWSEKVLCSIVLLS